MHSNIQKLFRSFILVLLLSACSKMGPTELGVKFRKLPPSLGGGVSKDIIGRGETAFLMPWDTVYTFDTRVMEIEWGYRGPNAASDYVETRALDGNEVALSVKIQYSIDADADKLALMIQEVATTDDEIDGLITSIGRTEVRTYMNELKTSQFFDNKQKYEAGEKAKVAIQDRVKKWGITIHSVNLGEHRFERTLRDGSIDASYQDKINEVQTTEEKTKREKLRKATVEADKEREYNDKQAEVNRVVAEVDGYKNQAKLNGDAYFEAKGNEAKSILAAGKAQVDGLIEQINALSGPGGEAILKLEIVKNLIQSNPSFFVLNSSSSSGSGDIQVRKVDTNELLKQIGLIEGMKTDEKKK
jgi:hypothetical protein